MEETVSVTTTEPAPQQTDYFGFEEYKTITLDDGVTWIKLKAMNEGDKARFQKLTQRDMILEKQSGNARFKIDPSEERHELLKASIVDWNLMRRGQPVRPDHVGLSDFLKLANPKVVERIELEIRKLNPWLMQDMTVEEIDRQIAELYELRKAAEERELGERDSSTR